MTINQCIGCERFPCTDVRHENYVFPALDLDPQRIRMVMISEAAPDNPADHYFSSGDPAYARTTLQAFQSAGAAAGSIHELVEQGIYFTTAVKCAKTGYGIQAATIEQCSFILEQELDQFPNVQAYLLMGDVAIRAVNCMAKHRKQPRVIPAGPTYKLRGKEYFYRGGRAFPSYLQVGPSFGIEKSKQRMIAEDIAAGLRLVRSEN